jgi:hypothetical protein
MTTAITLPGTRYIVALAVALLVTVVTFLRRFARIHLVMTDRPFGSLALVYVIIVTGVGGLAWPAPTFPRYLATRTLPHNHRIALTDIRRPRSNLAGMLGFNMESIYSIRGKYVTSAVPKDGSIDSTTLAEQPDMQPRNGTSAVAFQLPEKSRLLSLLDVDTPVELIAAGAGDSAALISIKATVFAIRCDGGDDSTAICFPILAIPSEELQLFAKNLAGLQLAIPASEAH